MRTEEELIAATLYLEQGDEILVSRDEYRLLISEAIGRTPSMRTVFDGKRKRLCFIGFPIRVSDASTGV